VPTCQKIDQNNKKEFKTINTVPRCNKTFAIWTNKKFPCYLPSPLIRYYWASPQLYCLPSVSTSQVISHTTITIIQSCILTLSTLTWWLAN